ncbi:MAG: hypothetical protein AAGF27_09885 [Pseudomonadota bacterium]
MKRHAIVFTCIFLAAPALAQDEREESCGYQGQVASAIREARLDGVKENRVESEILSGNPGWPATYNRSIPVLAGWVYQIDRKLLRDNDVGALWRQQCIDNWDTIQEMMQQQSG